MYIAYIQFLGVLPSRGIQRTFPIFGASSQILYTKETTELERLFSLLSVNCYHCMIAIVFSSLHSTTVFFSILDFYCKYIILSEGKIFYQKFMIRSRPVITKNLNLLSSKSPPVIVNILTCHRDNLDLSLWKSRPVIMKISKVHNKTSTCHYKKLELS